MLDPVRLTALRLLLCPVFVVAFVLGGAVGYAGALLVVLATELTGAIARRSSRTQGQEAAGQPHLLGPLAGTLGRLTVYVCLLGAGYAPPWVVVAVFCCDTMVAYLGVAAAHAADEGGTEGGSRTAVVAGRVRDLAHVVVVAAVLWIMARTPHIDPFAIEASKRTSDALMAVVGVVTLWWGAASIVRSLPALRALMRPAN